MRFDILTLFPTFFSENPYFEHSILGEAQKKGLMEFNVHNIRDYSTDKHHKVDDTPYGGGAGMVMTCQPLFDSIEAVKALQAKETGESGPVVYLTPQGDTWSQPTAEQWVSTHKNLILLCGRYEGIDYRVRQTLVDHEVSIGNYVLTGGELGSMVLIDSLTRLIPGVLGNEDSPEEDSFSERLDRKKEYPHYTKPAVFRDMKVPEVLRSGHHGDIEQWRRDHLH
jgi:tRNA (guanine37-N1)-methyltransferase